MDDRQERTAARAGSKEIGLVARARQWTDRTALLDAGGAHTYGDLLQASEAVARGLLERLRARPGAEAAPDLRGAPRDLRGAPVPFLVPPDFSHVAVQWGIWRAGGMAVPLAVSHPPRELAYVLDDADPFLAVVHPSAEDRLKGLAAERGIALPTTTDLRGDEEHVDEAPPPEDRPSGERPPSLPEVGPDRAALMLYTSGTTGRPKGVVHTHRSLEAQMRALTRAWAWSRDDRILLVLPLHHLHGILNVLACALWSGAACRMHDGFDAAETWERIGDGSLSLFMAVPTIYHRLVRHWGDQTPEVQEAWSRGARNLRLMVSGSAALPVTLLHKWRRITDHTLLERYGMTETGMILSNPLHGVRRPGHVGQPLPGVEVRLVDGEGRPVPGEGADGGVQVRGETLFREYWRRPDATTEAFTVDGWFRTGDVARLEDGSYRLLGRRSVDILKSGGYKISALEIESVLLEHPAIAECAVVGVPDPEWGQVVSAALVPADDGAAGTETASGAEASPLDPSTLRAWAKERLAPYKVPSRFLVADELPRNAMGKVQKPEVAELFSPGRSPGSGRGRRDGDAGGPSP